MAIAEIVAGAIEGIGNLGYNIYTNERDFDYQKSLQNQIFNREDNAIQRRVADLKAAGLNPNLAAGSAAGAGAVVGRSNTPNINGNVVGNALDMASHVQQLRNEREQNEILKNQKTISNYNADLERYMYATDKLAAIMDRASLYKQLGIDDVQLRWSKDGEVSLWSPQFSNGGDSKYAYKLNIQDSPLFNQISWQIQNNKNSADLLQKDVDWYTADKVGSYLGTIGNLFGAGASGYGNIMRGKYGYRRY